MSATSGTVQPTFPTSAVAAATASGVSDSDTGPVLPLPVLIRGWQTSEFYVTLLTQVVGLLVLAGVIHVNAGDPTVVALIQDIAGILAVVVPAGVYALARAHTKAVHAAVSSNLSAAVARAA